MTPRLLGESSTQVTIRLEDSVLTRIEALVAQLSPPGMSLARSELIRAALIRGIEAIESEHAKKKRR